MTAAPLASMSRREVLEKIARALPNDQGRQAAMTVLLQDMIDSYLREDLHRRVYVCPRRTGKTHAAAVLSLFEVLGRPHGLVLWLLGTEASGETVLMQKLGVPIRTSSWLRQFPLRVARNRITNTRTGATLEVLGQSEVAAPGRSTTLAIFDEARYLREEVVEQIMPSVMNGRVYAISSAGRPSGWLYDAVRDPGPRDHVKVFTSAEEIANPEFNVAFREEEKRRLERTEIGRQVYAREYCSSFEDLNDAPLLSREQVTACARPEIKERREGDVYFGAVDLSVSKDLTSLIVVAANADGTMRVVDLEVHDPKRSGGHLDFELVERRIEELHRKWWSHRIFCDQFQGVALCQNLTRRGVPIEPFAVTSAFNQAAFSNLLELISSEKLTWRSNQRLEDELVNLTLVETSSGGFLVRDHDRRLHRDLCFTLATACYFARDLALCYPQVF